MFEGLWDTVKKQLEDANYGVAAPEAAPTVISDDMVMQDAARPGSVPEIAAQGTDVYGANPAYQGEADTGSPSNSISVSENPLWFGAGGGNAKALENPFDNFFAQLTRNMDMARLEVPELRGSANFAEWHGAQKNINQLVKMAEMIKPLTSKGTYGIEMAKLAETKRAHDMVNQESVQKRLDELGIKKEALNDKLISDAMKLMPVTETDKEYDEAGNVVSSKKSQDLTNLADFIAIRKAIGEGKELTAEQKALLNRKGGGAGGKAQIKTASGKTITVEK